MNPLLGPIAISIIVGAAAGYCHFTPLDVAAQIVMVAAIGTWAARSAFRENLDRVYGLGVRPWGQVVIVAIWIYITWALASLTLQVPAYLLASWLHPIRN